MVLLGSIALLFYFLGDRASIPLKLQRGTLGVFKGEYQFMVAKTDALILSKYYPANRELKSAKVVISKYREGFTYTTFALFF
ncbi:hypothetical protein M3Y99_01671600 [Aphelenchoides fujianensis]|nr:hypothetical protein M3Y99_01671600 [Aphelenchoides fujianensis]